MHFAFLPLGLLIGSVAAYPTATPTVTRRDTSAIDNSLSRISANLQTLKYTIKTLPSGGSWEAANQKAQTLLDQLRTLDRTLESAVTAVKKGPTVGALEAVYVAAEVSTMSNLVSDVTTGFNTENTKKMIWYAGKKEAQSQFAQELARNSKVHDQFAAAIISKLPAMNQGLAGGIKSAFGALIQPAVIVRLPSTSRSRVKS
jgi:hypothetical protein